MRLTDSIINKLAKTIIETRWGIELSFILKEEIQKEMNVEFIRKIKEEVLIGKIDDSRDLY